MKNSVFGVVLGLSMTLGTATGAWGHAVQTDYFVDLFSAELALELVATYSSGEPMETATVLVYAPNDADTPWLESRTDAAGAFTFVPDASLAGDWRIEVTKAGHQDILIVPVDDTGIDYLNISHGGATDLHYAELSPAPLIVGSVLGIGGVVLALRRRRS